MTTQHEHPVSEDPLFQRRLTDYMATAASRCGRMAIFPIFDGLAHLADRSSDPVKRQRFLVVRHAAGHAMGIEPPEMDLRRLVLTRTGPMRTGRTRKSPVRIGNAARDAGVQLTPHGRG